jgi:hypothetical protein
MKAFSKLLVVGIVSLNLSGAAAFAAGQNSSPSSCAQPSDKQGSKVLPSEAASSDKDEQGSKADSAKK